MGVGSLARGRDLGAVDAPAGAKPRGRGGWGHQIDRVSGSQFERVTAFDPRRVIASRASSSARSFIGTPAWPGTYARRAWGRAASASFVFATSSWLAFAFHPFVRTPIEY